MVLPVSFCGVVVVLVLSVAHAVRPRLHVWTFVSVDIGSVGMVSHFEYVPPARVRVARSPTCGMV